MSAMQRRSQSSLSQPLRPHANSTSVSHKLSARTSKSTDGTHKRLAQGEPSPSSSEPTDENMADGGPSNLHLVLAEVKSLKDILTGKVTVLEGAVTGFEAKNAALEG